MEISNMMQQNLYSIKQALNIANMRKAMNQDAAAVNTLLNDMVQVNKSIMEHSVTPYKGTHIDLNV